MLPRNRLGTPFCSPWRSRSPDAPITLLALRPAPWPFSRREKMPNEAISRLFLMESMGYREHIFVFYSLFRGGLSGRLDSMAPSARAISTIGCYGPAKAATFGASSS